MSVISPERSISAMAGLEHLSPQLQEILRRITRTKIFKIKGAGEVDYSGFETDNQRIPAKKNLTGSFEGMTYINDPHDEFSPQKQIVALKKIVAKTNANGMTENRETYGYVEFNNDGMLFVDPANKQLLAFMLFSNNNGTWKHRDASRPIFWVEEKADAKNNTMAKTGEMLLMGKCIEMIDKMGLDKLKEYSSKIAQSDVSLNPLGKTSREMKYDLMVFARANPRAFIDTKIDDNLLIELAVKDAISIMELEYIDQTRSWHFKGDQNPIMQCSLQVKDKYEQELIEYLSNPVRRPTLNKLQEILMSED